MKVILQAITITLCCVTQCRSLELGERVQGKDHPDVAVTVRNLGALYALQGFPPSDEYKRKLLSRQ